MAASPDPATSQPTQLLYGTTPRGQGPKILPAAVTAPMQATVGVPAPDLSSAHLATVTDQIHRGRFDQAYRLLASAAQAQFIVTGANADPRLAELFRDTLAQAISTIETHQQLRQVSVLRSFGLSWLSEIRADQLSENIAAKAEQKLREELTNIWPLYEGEDPLLFWCADISCQEFTNILVTTIRDQRATILSKLLKTDYPGVQQAARKAGIDPYQQVAWPMLARTMVTSRLCAEAESYADDWPQRQATAAIKRAIADHRRRQANWLVRKFIKG